MVRDGRGRLYGVSVGPGDPDLLTVKAIRVIEAADVVAVPDVGRGRGRRSALDIVAGHLSDQEVLDCPFPMTRDREALDAAHEEVADQLARQLDAGKTVALVTLGDAGVYSSFYYVADRLRERGYEVEVIPGVPSFCAAAARLARPLCAGSEILTVVPVAGCDDRALSRALDLPGGKVFMKVGRDLPRLHRALEARGLADGAALAVDLGLPTERVEEGPLSADAEPGYFSLVLVGADASDAKGSGRVQGARSADPASRDGHDYPFVTHRDCPYFPCHQGVPEKDFNCLFCYCPLYALGPDCGGRFSYNAHGYKDCTDCPLPHRGDAGTRLVKAHFAQLADLARRGTSVSGCQGPKADGDDGDARGKS